MDNKRPVEARRSGSFWDGADRLWPRSTTEKRHSTSSANGASKLYLSIRKYFWEHITFLFTFRGLRVVLNVQLKKNEICVQETSQMISIYRCSFCTTDYEKYVHGKSKLRNKFTMFSFPFVFLPNFLNQSSYQQWWHKLLRNKGNLKHTWFWKKKHYRSY